MPVRSPRRAAAALAALAALSACTTAGHAVRSVEDMAEDVRALYAEPREAARVGILGTVTGAPPGVLEVNGLTVATAPDTLLSGGLAAPGPLSGTDIPPGHVVEIAAERRAGQLVAREVEPIFALAGPIGSVDHGARRLEVMDTTVVVPPEALLPAGGLGGLRPGQRVAISGLWYGETLVASRIDPRTVKGVADAVVSGVVAPLPGARYRIGGTPLAAELGTLRPGYFHVVTGDWVTGALVVDEVRLGRRVISRWPNEALVVEGYGEARDFAGFYSGYPGPDRDGHFPGYTFVGEEGKLGGDPAWRDHFVDIGGLGRPLDEREQEIRSLDGIRALFVGRHDGPWGGEGEGARAPIDAIDRATMLLGSFADLFGEPNPALFDVEGAPRRVEYADSFDGRFDVDHVIPLPERLDDRLATLRAVGDPLAPAAGAIEID